MSEKIKYSLNIQVAGGLSIPVIGEITTDAYGKIQVDVPAGASNLEVNLQPNGTDLMEFLLIKASTYDPVLTYKVNSDSATAIPLDSPHVFTGKGAVGILDSAPHKLFFSNGLTVDVTVDILVGRDATP